MGSETGGGGPTRLPNVTQVAGQTRTGITNLPGQNYNVAPQLQSIGRQGNQAGINYFPGVTAGANQGAQIGGQTAQGVGGFAQGLIPYAQQVEQMGFDPQKALYNRTLQQVQDQARVAQATRGVANSPYGAGLENDATRNFNIDWQNQQLNRATQAATSAQGLGSSAFNLGSGASDLAASAAKMPYSARQGLLSDRANALAGVGGQITAANQPRQQAISDFLSYLGMGPGYQSSAAAQQQASQQLPNTMIGGALGALPALLGK
jgi:hypothetical protein